MQIIDLIICRYPNFKHLALFLHQFHINNTRLLAANVDSTAVLSTVRSVKTALLISILTCG